MQSPMPPPRISKRRMLLQEWCPWSSSGQVTGQLYIYSGPFLTAIESVLASGTLLLCSFLGHLLLDEFIQGARLGSSFQVSDLMATRVRGCSAGLVIVFRMDALIRAHNAPFLPQL